MRRLIARPNYSGSESAFVYESCVEVARKALEHGRPAILDGTFARQSHRAGAIWALQGLYGRLVVVHIVCSFEVADRRNRARSHAIVPERRLRGIYASFQEPYGALRIDSELHSAEGSAAIVLSAVRQRHTDSTDVDRPKTPHE